MKWGTEKRIGKYYRKKVSDICVPEIPDYVLKKRGVVSSSITENNSGYMFLAASVVLSLSVLFYPGSYKSPVRGEEMKTEKIQLVQKEFNSYFCHFTLLIKKELN